MQIRIELSESRLLRAVCALQWGLALLALCLAQLPLVLRLAGMLILLCYLFRRRARPQVLSLVQGQMSLDMGQGMVPVCLRPECYCHPALIVLRFEALPVAEGLPPPVQLPAALVLLPDSASAESLRALRMALRWQKF
ncbi:MAG: hypothetical protein H7A05_03235 [Pseudomonadales bacterium]|nr:hypothetical protein [Pseudomonadales bacterium]MCP5331150.1 hypothetical protein [Pseudomonadales bacterium]MCP5343613.1 hypothetical protein [Pseudomonadales bacterium]